MSDPADNKALETRIGGIFVLLGSAFLFFFVTDTVFMATDVDVRWLLVVFVPTGLAMIIFPRVSWLQKR